MDTTVLLDLSGLSSFSSATCRVRRNVQVRICKGADHYQIPHLQVWATQMLPPRCRATATRTVSSANLNPQEVTGIAKSQSPL